MKITCLPLLVITITISGCLAVVLAGGILLGAGAYSYTTNEFTQDYSAPLGKVYSAAIRAIRDLNFRLVDHKKDALQGHVNAKRADDTPIKIILRSTDRKVTNVSIRVGTLSNDSNKQAAMAISDKMARLLRR